MEEGTTAVPARHGTFAALAYPNYRLWFTGQMTSLFGTWMQPAAQGCLIFELTRSEAYLGPTTILIGAGAAFFCAAAVAAAVPSVRRLY